MVTLVFSQLIEFLFIFRCKILSLLHFFLSEPFKCSLLKIIQHFPGNMNMSKGIPFRDGAHSVINMIIAVCYQLMTNLISY